MKTETIGSITGNLASGLSNRRPNVRSVVFAALGLWFGLVFFLASQGAFVASAGSPPLPSPGTKVDSAPTRMWIVSTRATDRSQYPANRV